MRLYEYYVEVMLMCMLERRIQPRQGTIAFIETSAR
jgi:hypothetical protein